MKVAEKTAVLCFCALVMLAVHIRSPEALAQSGYFSSQGCSGCHAAPVVATCNGCHAHGTHPNSGKNAINVAGTTDKGSYAPGETVTVTMTGGYRTGWFRAVLYDQNMAELARSSGNDSGMGSSAVFPAVLTAPAPATPGTYTWKVAWYGNQYDAAGGAFGSGWAPDAQNPNHGSEIVSIAAPFTVATASAPAPAPGPAPVTAPSISSVTPGSLVQGAVNQIVTITGANLADATVSFSNTGVVGGPVAATATSITLPVIVAANAATGTGTITISTAGGRASGTLSVTPRSSAPALIISALSDGSYTNNATLNISGSVSAATGIQSVIVNNQYVTVMPNGYFSTALVLVPGANAITVTATDNSGNSKSDSRTINFDPNAPILSVAAPADNSTSASSFIAVSGSVNETSTVAVTTNNGSPQFTSIIGNNFSVTVNLEPGVNTINIAATDLAGNTASAKRTVTYDTSKLTLAVTNPSQDMTTNRSTLILMGTVTNSSKEISVTITMDGKTYTHLVTNGIFKQRLTFTDAKLYVITVSARDAAGNSNTVIRNVMYGPAQDGAIGATASHPFGWTNPRSSHPGYVEKNGVTSCVGCHSIDQASKGQAMSCYNCHGKKWDTPASGGATGGTTTGGTTTGTTTGHPFGWTNPRSSHPGYVEKNGVSGCVSCHSIDQASKGQAMSCYNCHGKKW